MSNFHPFVKKFPRLLQIFFWSSESVSSVNKISWMWKKEWRTAGGGWCYVRGSNIRPPKTHKWYYGAGDCQKGSLIWMEFLQTMKWVTAFTLRREQKGTFVVHGKTQVGILSHWKSKCARPKGRSSRQLQVAKYVKSTMSSYVKRRQISFPSACEK